MVKNRPANAGDPGSDSIPGSGRSSGGGKSNPLQYCCLENSKDRGAWWATVYGVSKNRTQLNTQGLRQTQTINVAGNILYGLALIYLCSFISYQAALCSQDPSHQLCCLFCNMRLSLDQFSCVEFTPSQPLTVKILLIPFASG